MSYYRAELLAGSLLVLVALPCVAIDLLRSNRPATSATAPAVLDINRSGVFELEALPGVGPKTAAKILRGRPYAAPDELAAVIGSRVLARIRPFVTVRPESSPSEPR